MSDNRSPFASFVSSRTSELCGRRISLCALFCWLVACFEPGGTIEGETEDVASSGSTGGPATGEPATGDPTTGTAETGDPTTGNAPTGDPTDPDDTSSSGDSDDTTPPTLLSVSPENGATGVLADVAFVFEFSERMDASSTEAAYQSSHLPSSEVSFAWNGAGTVMTIVPNEPLVHAAGSDDSVVAETYSFSLTVNATDLAGNELETQIDVSFSTARRLTMQLAADQDLSGITNPGGTYSEASEYYAVGDWGNAFPPGVLRAPLTFDISEIPDPVVEWVGATIGLMHTGQLGNAYATHGSLHVHDVSFATFDVEAGESPRDDLGMLSDAFDDDELASLVVTTAVAADHASGQTQFLLMFDDETPASNTTSDSVEGGLENIHLEVEVLVD